MSTLRTLILPFCILAGMAILIGLGTWQMKRLAWKEGLIKKVEMRLQQPPVPIEELWQIFAKAYSSPRIDADQSGLDIEYAPTTATGTFKHKAEQYYFATHKGRSGWYVYTPLVWNDAAGVETVLLVNRGFVPPERKDPATRKQGQIEGVVTINGLARGAPSEKPNMFVPNNDLAKNEYFWKDWSNMLAESGYKMKASAVPFFLDADDAPNKGGLPVGGVTRIMFSNSHLQYALTWYGLALALAGVGIAFMYSRRRNDASQQV